jgi:hypothetical protein
MRSLAPRSLEGYGKCARNPFRFRSYTNAPSASRMASTEDQGGVAPFLPSTSHQSRITSHVVLPVLCFHHITNPSSSNTLLFTSIQNPRGVTPPMFPQRLGAFVSRTCAANPVSSAACRLFISLCPPFRTRSLCFQAFAASFAKIPGVGVGFDSSSAFGPSDAPWHPEWVYGTCQPSATMLKSTRHRYDHP